jgi:hypothetical protein
MGWVDVEPDVCANAWDGTKAIEPTTRSFFRRRGTKHRLGRGSRAGTFDFDTSSSEPAAARQSVQAVIEAYRKAFDQQSVPWESARVCVAA